jgi:hypothetical protein
MEKTIVGADFSVDKRGSIVDTVWMNAVRLRAPALRGADGISRLWSFPA